MLPEMRAFADKLILDVANVQYLAAAVGPRALEKHVPTVGWTVRQVLGHLALSMEEHAPAIDALLAADPSNATAPDWDARNAEQAKLTAKMPLPEIMERMSQGRDATITRVLALTDAELSRPVAGEHSLRAVMDSWLPHCEAHALDFADAFPDLRMDPMVLNWVLYADLTHSPDLLARQQKIAAEARDHYGERIPEPDEEQE